MRQKRRMRQRDPDPMEDPRAAVRERRYQSLVSDLLPRLRRLNPMMDDENILEIAESMAELRLLDEEIDR